MTDAGSGPFGWRWPLALAAATLLHLAALGPLASSVDQQAAGTARGAGDHEGSIYEIRIAPAPAARAAVSGLPEPVEAEAPQDAGGGGRGGYYARVRAHLQRHREHVTAQAQGARTAVVRFRVGGDGAVSAVALMRGSGDPQLDRAALDLLRRASPLPAPPQQRPLNLSVPIEFE